jgi:hypothetical protein
MKISHKIGFDILNLKILFSSMINVNIFFNSVKTLHKNYMFKVHLSKFMEIQTSSQSQVDAWYSGSLL